MIVSINQPAYLPWLGYFHRILSSDQHIVLDHVQFEKNSYTNRNKILTKNGWIWLTIPVLTKGKFGDLCINNVEINNTINWKKKHWNAIFQNYKKSKFFDEHLDFFKEVYSREWVNLIDICECINTYILSYLSIEKKLVYSSTFNIADKKDDLILSICKKYKADTYLSGIVGRDYLVTEKFDAESIEITYQDYNHPEYQQLDRTEFEPYMSIIDLLFNHGKDSIQILQGNNLNV